MQMCLECKVLILFIISNAENKNVAKLLLHVIWTLLIILTDHSISSSVHYKSYARLDMLLWCKCISTVHSTLVNSTQSTLRLTDHTISSAVNYASLQYDVWLIHQHSQPSYHCLTVQCHLLWIWIIYKLCQSAIWCVMNASTQKTVNPPTVWPF